VGPDPGIPFRLFGIFCVNVQFSKAKAKGVCGYLDLRNKDEIFTLEELLAQDLQDFWTVIDVSCHPSAQHHSHLLLGLVFNLVLRNGALLRVRTISLIPLFVEQIRIHQQGRQRPRSHWIRLATGHCQVHEYLQEPQDYSRGDCERRNAGRSPIAAREAYTHGSYMSLLALCDPPCVRRCQTGPGRRRGLSRRHSLERNARTTTTSPSQVCRSTARTYTALCVTSKSPRERTQRARTPPVQESVQVMAAVYTPALPLPGLIQSPHRSVTA